MDTVSPRHLDSVALIAGALVSGLAVYGVSIVGIRAYGSAGFSPMSVLWTVWAVLAAVLTFPIQHWIIHTVARDGDEDAVASALPRLVLGAVVLAVVLGALSWAFGDRLFGTRRFVWPAFVAVLTIGASLTGIARGVLAGRRRFRSVAAIIAAENLLRLVACALVVGLNGSVEAFGWAFVSGAACVVAWPAAFRLSARAVRPAAPLAGFVGGLGGGNVIAQVVLTAGPLALSVLGGDAHDVTALFVTMALFRAPYMVALGLSVQLTGPVTQMAVAGQRVALRRITLRTVGASLAVAGLAFAIGLTVGVRVVDLIYGSSTAPGSGVVALVAAGSAVALGTLTLSVMLAAQSATTRIAASWVAAVVVAAIVIAAVRLDPIVSIALGFTAAEIVALIAMAASPA